jgi:hypothetical protein
MNGPRAAKRVGHLAAASVVVGAGLLALGGCSARMPDRTPPSKVWGYVAAANKAQLDVNESQVGVSDFVVRRVLAPSDAWVVVSADLGGGRAGMRLGMTHVKRGETLNVRVPLDKITTANVVVALYADRGTIGQFDVDALNPDSSADRPVLVNEAALAKVVAVRAYGVPVDASQASLVASDQVGATRRIVISQVLSPTDAWVVVSLDQDGGAGERVGLHHVSAGVSTNVTVTLDPVPLTNNLRVALHTDAGDPGLFNFDPSDMINSPDQPFFVSGRELAIAVRVK